MLYSDSERAWLERRAAEIATATGWPLPIASSEACAQLTRSRASGQVVALLQFPFGRPRPKTPKNQASVFRTR